MTRIPDIQRKKSRSRKTGKRLAKKAELLKGKWTKRKKRR